LLDDDGEIVALLDWEITHLGDPHEDLGWVTQPLRTKEHFIKGTWERAELLDHYETASGHPVDHDAVRWWNVLAAYKTAVMQASGLRAFVEGRSDEHYQPSAPVLKALIAAAMPPNVAPPSSPDDISPLAFPGGDATEFLRWDTTGTVELLRHHGVAPIESFHTIDALKENQIARQQLVELIRTLPLGQPGESARNQLGSHLLQRVSANPALARRIS
jgi:Phosphotransferase enzyme family